MEPPCRLFRLLLAATAAVVIVAFLVTPQAAYAKQAMAMWESRIDLSINAEHPISVCGNSEAVYIAGYVEGSYGQVHPLLVALDRETGKLIGYNIRTSEEGFYTSCAATESHVVAAGYIGSDTRVALYTASGLDLVESKPLWHVTSPDYIVAIGDYIYIIGTDSSRRLAVEKYLARGKLSYKGYHITSISAESVLDAKYDPSYDTVWLIINNSYGRKYLTGFTSSLLFRTTREVKGCRLQPLPGGLAVLGNGFISLLDKDNMDTLTQQWLADAYCTSMLGFMFPYRSPTLIIAAPYTSYTKLIAYRVKGKLLIPYISTSIRHSREFNIVARNAYIDMFNGNIYVAYANIDKRAHSGYMYALAIHIAPPTGGERTITVTTTKTKTVTATTTRTVNHVLYQTVTKTKTVTRTTTKTLSLTTTIHRTYTHTVTKYRTKLVTRIATVTLTKPTTTTTTATKEITEYVTRTVTKTLEKTITVTGSSSGNGVEKDIVLLALIAMVSVIALMVRP